MTCNAEARPFLLDGEERASDFQVGASATKRGLRRPIKASSPARPTGRLRGYSKGCGLTVQAGVGRAWTNKLIGAAAGGLMVIGAPPAHAQARHDLDAITAYQASPRPNADRPAHAVEWDSKNQLEKCHAARDVTICQGTIDLGLQLAKAAVQRGMVRDGFYLLSRSTDAATVLSYRERERSEASDARAEKILLDQVGHIQQLIKETNNTILFLVAPQVSGELLNLYLESGQLAKAYAFASEVRAASNNILTPANLQNAASKEPACTLVNDLKNMEANFRRSLVRIKVDLMAAEPAAVKARVTFLSALNQAHCGGVKLWD